MITFKNQQLNRNTSNKNLIKKLSLSLFVSTLLISFGFINSSSVNADGETPQIRWSDASIVNLKNNKQEKPRIAVLDFDHSSVASNWSWWWRSSARGVSDMLVNKLVETNKFRVIERSKLDAILAEQNLGASGRVDTSTAAKIGNILGVDTVVIGSVTEFNIERGGGGVRVGGLRVGGKKAKANVQLNVRLVNTSTAEILMTAQGNGKSKNTGGSISLSRVDVRGSSRKDAKLLTNATAKAIDEIVEKIEKDSKKLQ